MHYEDTYDESALWNRISIVALTLMAAAFMFAVISPVFASADDVAGVRDDDQGDLISNEDDDDDDQGDDDQGTDGTGQPSIGSQSANTATGTTKGTGVSNSVSNSSDKSANTATGTTQGTGASNNSVSNSS